MENNASTSDKAPHSSLSTSSELNGLPHEDSNNDISASQIEVKLELENNEPSNIYPTQLSYRVPAGPPSTLISHRTPHSALELTNSIAKTNYIGTSQEALSTDKNEAFPLQTINDDSRNNSNGQIRRIPTVTTSHGHRPSLVSGLIKLMALHHHHQQSSQALIDAPNGGASSTLSSPAVPSKKLQAFHKYNYSVASVWSNHRAHTPRTNFDGVEATSSQRQLSRKSSQSTHKSNSNNPANLEIGSRYNPNLNQRKMSVFRESPAFDSNIGSIAAAALQNQRHISATFSTSSRDNRQPKLQNCENRAPSNADILPSTRKPSLAQVNARTCDDSPSTTTRPHATNELYAKFLRRLVSLKNLTKRLPQLSPDELESGSDEYNIDTIMPDQQTKQAASNLNAITNILEEETIGRDVCMPKDDRRAYLEHESAEAGKRFFGSLHDMEVAIQYDIDETLNRQDFLVRLCKAFWMYGCPSYRLVSYMHACSQALDIEASFACFPAMLIISFGDPETHTSETHIIKCVQGYDLDRLQDTSELAVRLCHDFFKAKALQTSSTTTLHEVEPNKKFYVVDIGKDFNQDTFITVSEAMDTLQSITHRPPCYSNRTQMIQLTFSSVFLALNAYGGYWQSMLLSAVEGAIVASLVYLTGKFERYANMLEIGASIIIGFLAQVLSYHVPGVCFWTLVLSGIVNLLPGLGIVLSVTELAARNMVIGTTRLFYSLVVCGMLGFGIMIGSKIAWWVPQSNAATTNVCLALPNYAQWLFYPPVCLCFAISLKTRPAHLVPAVVIGSISFAVWLVGTTYVGDRGLATVMSAFSIAVLAHLYTKVSHTVALAAALPALLYLLPGSLALRGLASLLIDGSVNALTLSLNVLETSFAITAGLFVANMIVMPMSNPKHISI